MMYSWVPVYKEIANNIITYRAKQGEILDFLKTLKAKDLPVISLDDMDKRGNTIPLAAIDPFTFFACFNRGVKESNRIEIVGEVIKWLGLSCNVPVDFLGTPVANNMKSWFFPYLSERNKTDIDCLWDMANEVLSKKPEQVNAEAFNKCLKIRGVSANLTMGCFWLNPDEYVSLDSTIREYIKTELGISPKVKDYTDYLNVIKEIRKQTKTPFAQFSHEAWQWGNANPPKKYWAGGIMWDTVRKEEEFVKNNYWQIGWKRSDTQKAARDTYALYDQINIGDEFAIKGLGGTHDLKIYYVGKVVSKEDGIGKLNLTPLKNRKLYSGKAPKGPGVGNWHNTLIPVTQPEHINDIFGISPPPPPFSNPVNLILYGPPGTGKTFKLQNEYFKDFISEDAISKDALLYDVAERLSWWEIVAIALIDLKSAKVPDIFNHELVQSKIMMMANKSPKTMIWVMLQIHTVDDCEHVKYTKRLEPFIFRKSADSYWTLVEDKLQSEFSYLFDEAKKLREFKPTPMRTARYEFVTFHQSYSYEEFIEGIRPQLDGEDSTGSDIRYEIKKGIFRRIAERAYHDPDNQYALFIDEINRGNISKIFGELITLVELDKRINKNNPDKGLKTKLPYSQDEFGVPDNLSIIGTMNTADRSIAFIDTALRRRFQFMEMMSDYEAVRNNAGNIDGMDVSMLLRRINERIEFLFDRDHTIGHSYFLKVKSLDELRKVFLLQVIPLLQEYFHRDWEKMCLVLGCSSSGDGDVNQQNPNPIIKATSINSQQLLGGGYNGYSDKRHYEINEDFINAEENELAEYFQGIFA